jgi:hypothetical protein
MDKNPSWETTRSSASEGIPTFCGTQRFIVAFTVAHQLPLSYARPIQPSLQSHFLKIYSNIVLTSTSRSIKLPLSFRSPHQKRVPHPPSSSPYVTRAPPPASFFLIWSLGIFFLLRPASHGAIICDEKYKIVHNKVLLTNYTWIISMVDTSRS